MIVPKLYAPAHRKYGDQPCCYHDATPEAIAAVAGGCGPGGVGDFLVPDTMWLLSVKPACSIHDYMYRWGLTEEDRALADEVFFNNMVRIIKAQKSWKWLEKKRLKRAELYYNMVSKYGSAAFWNSKNELHEMA